MSENRVEYSWRFKDDVSRNIRVYEITRTYVYEKGRPVTNKPFTVILYDYPTVRDKKLFSDLFFSDEWGRNTDVNFCAELWKEFGLEDLHGPFTQEQIEHDLTRAPPKIYRDTIENVMDTRFGNQPLDMVKSKKSKIILEEFE